jgi:hypothetical protein
MRDHARLLPTSLSLSPILIETPLQCGCAAGSSPEFSMKTLNANNSRVMLPTQPVNQFKNTFRHARRIKAESPLDSYVSTAQKIHVQDLLSCSLPFFFLSVPSMLRPALSSCIASSSLSSSTENKSQLGLLHTCGFPDSVRLPALRPGRMGAGCGFDGCLRLSMRWLWR